MRLKENRSSPEFIKISHSSAVSLGLIRTWMYRGAKNRCINLLVQYPEGCKACCAYCGLSRKRPGSYEKKSFISVNWPIYPLEQIIAKIKEAPSYVKRTCISMITNKKCLDDTLYISERLIDETRLPLSILISPSIIKREYLEELKDIGVDMIGVAIDLARPDLFDLYRGKGVKGPHRWKRYWDVLEDAIEIFKPYHVGVHLMVGMGESEKDMVNLMDRLWNMKVCNHLFSFFPEQGSVLSHRDQPPWDVYLRIQLARFLIEEGISDHRRMQFDQNGRIVDFGINFKELEEIISTGIPFMTTGCLGDDGQVACNRPFGNCLPGPRQWNYPYRPNEEEIELIKKELLDSNYN